MTDLSRLSEAKLSTQLALAIVSLVLAVTATLGVITYVKIASLGVPRALDRLQTRSLLNATRLETALNNVRRDVEALRASNSIADLIAGSSDRIPGDLQKRLAGRFVGELTAKPTYDRMRIVGLANGGRELIRVDRLATDGSIRVVPETELKQKGQKSYFRQAMLTPLSDVFMSDIILKRDAGGAIRVPNAPVVRVAAPLQTQEGRLFGTAVIDVGLGSELDRIRRNSAGGSVAYVVNARGDYLVHPDREREFAFERGRAPRVYDEFADFDLAIAGSSEGRGIWKDRAGESFGVGWSSARPTQGPRITILEVSDYAALTVGAQAAGYSTLIGGSVAVLFAIGLSILLARSLSRPIVRMTEAVRQFSESGTFPTTSGGGKEIHALSLAFQNMASDIRQKSALLHNTILSIADPVLVSDNAGNITIANGAAQRLLGVVPGTCSVEKRSFELFDSDGVTPLPFDASAMARALRGEEVNHLSLVVRTGTASSEVLASARPIFDERGALCGGVVVYHDVTGIKQALAALSTSEQMARIIVETALDAFVQVDSDGLIARWSPKAEEMLGWTCAEATGKRLRDLIVPERNRAANAKRIGQLLHKANSGVTGLRYISPTLCRDGREILTEISATALVQDGRSILNVFLRDITQQKAAEQQLQQAQKMECVGQLSGGIAHDFNNMLTVITGTIEILAEGVADRPALAAIVKMIDGASMRAADLTANLLSFARKRPLLPTGIDVNQLVLEVRGLLEPTLGRNIEIRTELDADAWPACADEGQLSSALVNLAINARDAMPSGGRLTLRTRNVMNAGVESEAGEQLSAGQYSVIEVIDSGSGIPDAIRSKIFEPFFTTKGPGKGTGLGLSMVYGFVKQSGGHIEVAGSENGGALFRIYLPTAAEDDAGEAMPMPTSVREFRRERILCVEDDAIVRKFVVAQLESMGLTVIPASSAAEALEYVSGGAPFDLLFTDIVMPGQMDGFELATEILNRRPGTKVLFTTGFDDGALVRYGRLGPGTLLLSKPYRRDKLTSMLRLALGLESSAKAVA
jgi:PAS domain S-box-containing protein